MAGTCFLSVSNAALCQRCPMLLAYKIHMGINDVWKIGINGSGYAYGSMFHKNIARVFFEAASDSSHHLHRKISDSIPHGRDSLEGVIRENIFMPFLSRESENYTSGQILSMAKGITVWTRAMSEFFSLIPSLQKNPEKFMRTVFIPPEQKLQACYDFDGVKLNVAGCYDALLFNPDKCEARLFEFKGYMKSDISVPLSQSLIYSWLIWKHTGVIPSVEIIYLGEDDKEPEIFSPSSVREMIIAGLPGLFRSAFGVISLKGVPEISRDEKLCRKCPFDGKCANDWRSLKVKKRRGASLINVMVFMMFTVMVTAQVFFFSKTSSDSLAEEREIMLYRLRLDSLVEEAKDKLKVTGTGEIIHDRNLHTLQNNTTSATSIYQGTTSIYTTPLKYSGFYDGTKLLDENNLGNEWKNSNYHVRIHDLDYSFDARGVADMSSTGNTNFTDNDRQNWTENYGNTNAHKKLFAAMPALSFDADTSAEDDVHNYTITNRFYLIRAWVQLPENFFSRKIMYQVLVSRDERDSSSATYHNVDVLSFQEVWF